MVDMLLLQLLLVVWLGPSAVFAHPGGPPGSPGLTSMIRETSFDLNEHARSLIEN
jgi:hypothetical protein